MRGNSTIAVAVLALVIAACGQPQTGAQPPGVATERQAACTLTVVAGEGTLADTVDGLQAGDVVCLSGSFSEQLVLTRGGTASAPVTIRSLDAADPAVLSPTGSVAEGDNGIVELRDIAHVRIEGLNLTGWQTDQLGHTPAGILVVSSGSTAMPGIELVGNTIHDLGHTHPAAFTDAELADCEVPVAECAGEMALQIQAFGIAVKGRASAPISGLRVADNNLFNLTLGGSESLAINGNVEDFEVTDNVIHDVNNIAIDAIGFEDLDGYPAGTPEDQKQARRGLMAGNLIWNVSSNGNPAYGQYGDDGTAQDYDRSAVGLYIDGGRDIIIERNVVLRADLGVEVAAEYDLGTTQNCIVRSNVIGQTDFAGIAVGGYADETDDAGQAIDDAYNGEGDATGIHILHNTVHTAGGGAALMVQYRVGDSVVAGNILAAGDGEARQGVDAGAYDDIELTANLEVVADAPGANPDGIFVTADLPDDAALQAGITGLGESLHLAPESSAVDAGQSVTGAGDALPLGSLDIDGDPRANGPVDQGADELAGVQSSRISGSNRFSTAAAVAAADHPSGSDTVVLARADNFADALASAPVAFGADAPVLVTNPDELNAETAAEIDRLSPQRVLLFGGVGAISDAVATPLSQSYEVQRIAGSNRYATAAEAARFLAARSGIGVDGAGDRVAMVAEAGDPLGPLAAGVPAAIGRFPILLVDPDRLPEETSAALTGNGIAVVDLIGNSSQISDGVRAAIEALGITVQRVQGTTALETVAAVARMGAQRGLLTGQGAVLGRGDNVVDTLTAGPHAASRRVPILLTENPSTLGGAAQGWLADPTSRSRGLIEAIGGTAAVSEAVLQQAVTAAAG